MTADHEQSHPWSNGTSSPKRTSTIHSAFFPCSELLTSLTGNLETQTMDSMIFRRFFHVMSFILGFGGESFGEGVSLLDDLWFPTFVSKSTGSHHAERLQCPAKVGQRASWCRPLSAAWHACWDWHELTGDHQLGILESRPKQNLEHQNKGLRL